MTLSNAEYKQKYIEYLILLLLGDFKNKLSVLHIQKEIYLLYNFDVELKKLFSFVKHYKGPYLDLINSCCETPFYLDGCWEYFEPKEKISGGFLKITDKGYKEYLKFLQKIKDENQEELLHINTAISMLNRLYGSLDCEELLLLIYTEFPEYTEKSEVYSNIISKKTNIAKNLFEKKVISEEKYNELSGIL
ncbi:hypothetical protein mru_0061 [Methanobrevibacter ruminantium M1]|uniref:Antitoxin SocA-like Panacea domain-containing protein n=1 Tax=Methanobrevibacter ruminantium (strain ATCC 35063 / DSM 1093 / JCM 13430 / OCM 146 / M1) TaxID=634498 RepID=D3E4L7_METRM|nr:hypothetical protein [Methanobrevibacter ruminantium]ADC45913.1 hypothetical protein mru_0061 [Methanobrevibacter ruminantium M1]